MNAEPDMNSGLYTHRVMYEWATIRPRLSAWGFSIRLIGIDENGSMSFILKMLARLKSALHAWLRQPQEELSRRQEKNDIQSLLPPR